MGSKEPRSVWEQSLFPLPGSQGVLWVALRKSSLWSPALSCLFRSSFIHSCIHSSVHQTPADFFLHAGPWLGTRDTPVLRHGLQPHRAQSPGRNRPKAHYPNSGPCGCGVDRDGFLEEVDPEQTPEGQGEGRTHSSLGRAVSGKEERKTSVVETVELYPEWQIVNRDTGKVFQQQEEYTLRPKCRNCHKVRGAEGPRGWYAGAWDAKRNGTWLGQRQDRIQV